uniref:Aldo_ket_red domain-containing protein n=1 Tax=Syphacia muris TaxID=451379 RepID=A0A0N5AXN1_9BILA
MVFTGPAITLSTLAKMPQIGLGTWLSSPGAVKGAVRQALDCGYRLIDTAELYKNEAEIGEVINEYIVDGKIKREELFVTTKAWCSHFHPSDMENALRDSLKRLRLNYVDLYLAHEPGAFSTDMSKPDNSFTVEKVWKSLEGVYDKGLTKAIGVSNFSIPQIERVVHSAKIPVHNVQVECYLYLPQFELAEVCKRNNISLTAYGPLGSPGRSSFKESGAKMEWKPGPIPLEDPLVKKLAEKYNKTPAQILLRHLLQRQIAIIPKSVNANRIKENFNIFDFELTADEVNELNKPKHHQRLFFHDL